MALPKSARRTALETLYNLWKHDPDLQDFVHTWRMGRDKADYKDVDSAQCPWVRITPAAMPARFADTTKLDSPILLKFELVLQGYDQLLMADFWGALEFPVSSLNRTNMATMNAVGIEVVQPTMPAITAEILDGGLMRSKGEMIVKFYEMF